MADINVDSSKASPTGVLTHDGTGPGRSTAAQVRTLLNVEDGATADQTGAEIKSAYEGEADTNAFTDDDHSKLDAIEANADVTDATSVASAGAVMADGTGDDLTGDLVFDEKADHSSTPAAGHGYVWVKNTAPSTLIFTDDAGTDTTLGSGGGSGDSWSDAVDADIVPDGDGTRDLGSSANRFAEVHADRLLALGSDSTAEDVAHSSAGAIDLSGVTANHVRVTVGANVTGDGITPPSADPASGKYRAIRVDIVMDGTGGYTIADLAGNADVTLATGTIEPTISTAANAITTIVLEGNSSGAWTLYGDPSLEAAQLPAATTSANGAIKKATASTINTGTADDEAITPDGLAGSNLGAKPVIAALNGSTALTTSDKFYFRAPDEMAGMDLVGVKAAVGTGAAGSSSSGTPTFTITNVTSGQSMLSTNLTVDQGEYTSATAATAAVIDTSEDDLAADDLIEVAVTTAGTGVTYATVTMVFQLP